MTVALFAAGALAAIGLLAAAEAPACDASNPNLAFNPHDRPSGAAGSPWFEGWFVRVSDTASRASLAVGIGHYPGQAGDLRDPPAACFILVSGGAAAAGAAADGDGSTAATDPAASAGTEGVTRAYAANFDSLVVTAPAEADGGEQAGGGDTSSSGSGSSSSGGSSSSSGSSSGSGSGSREDVVPDPYWDLEAEAEAGDGMSGMGDAVQGPKTATAGRPHIVTRGSAAWSNLGKLLRAGGATGNASGAVSFALRTAASASDAGGSGGDHCSWRVTPDGVRIRASVGGARLRLRTAPAACAAAEPWAAASGSGDGGGGDATPERWLARLGFLLRLQYDVLTVRTPVRYALQLPAPHDTAAATAETPRLQPQLPVWRAGLLHVEKNWGSSFPGQWVWSQGHRDGGATGQQASFVLAGGLLPHVLQPYGIPAVRQYVLSYHPPPPGAPITIDPADPPLASDLAVRGCDGVLALTLYSPLHVAQLVASAAPESFAAVPCPTESGFRNYSVQSFSARVQLRLLRRPFPFAPPAAATLVAEDEFVGAALEFGGDYVCPERMPQLRGVERGWEGAWGSREESAGIEVVTGHPQQGTGGRLLEDGAREVAR